MKRDLHLGGDDDESWLAVDPQELDQLLQSKEVVGLEPSDIKGQADILTGQSAPSKPSAATKKKQPTGLIQAATPAEELPSAKSTTAKAAATTEAKSATNAEEATEANVSAASESLAHVAQGVNDFMSKVSGYKGVQPQHLSVHSSKQKKNPAPKEKSDREIEFDLTKLMAALQGDVEQGGGNASFNDALKRLGVNTDFPRRIH